MIPVHTWCYLVLSWYCNCNAPEIVFSKSETRVCVPKKPCRVLTTNTSYNACRYQYPKVSPTGGGGGVTAAHVRGGGGRRGGGGDGGTGGCCARGSIPVSYLLRVCARVSNAVVAAGLSDLSSPCNTTRKPNHNYPTQNNQPTTPIFFFIIIIIIDFSWCKKIRGCGVIFGFSHHFLMGKTTEKHLRKKIQVPQFSFQPCRSAPVSQALLRYMPLAICISWNWAESDELLRLEMPTNFEYRDYRACCKCPYCAV